MVQSFLKKNNLKQYPFHGCQFGVTDLEGNPVQKGRMVATNMEELSGLAGQYVDRTYGYPGTTHFLASAPIQNARERKRLAVPAMSRSSDDKSKSKTI